MIVCALDGERILASTTPRSSITAIAAPISNG